MSVGAFADGTYLLNGRIDELALYKRVLTAAERTWLYNSSKGRSYANLGAQLHAVTGAVTSSGCPQGEVCDYDQATPLPSPHGAGRHRGRLDPFVGVTPPLRYGVLRKTPPQQYKEILRTQRA